jgi:DNA-binding transcriptional LysR family regulator
VTLSECARQTVIAHNDPSHVRDRVLRLFEQHHIPANILVSLPSLEGIKRAVAMRMGVALLPRRCAESEIARGELVALAMPEIRLRRQVRLVYRKAAERSHASAAFLAVVEGARSVRKNVAPDAV